MGSQVAGARLRYATDGRVLRINGFRFNNDCQETRLVDRTRRVWPDLGRADRSAEAGMVA